jgi:hypothetical protein
VRIVNSTFGRNTASEGGGIVSSADTELLNVTLKENSAAVAGAILNASGTVTLQNSIVADSVGGGQNCRGPIVSRGHNLDSGTSCGLRLLPDYEGIRVLLDDLRFNGGTMPTYKPLPGSPAIDSGPTTRGSCPTRDQRGVPRPADGDGDGARICDRGAVEVERPGG